MTPRFHTDILVIGDHLFSLLISLYLRQQGAQVLRVSRFGSEPISPTPDFDILWSSMSDPPTRARVAHGQELAEYLLGYLKKGQEVAKELVSSKIFQDAQGDLRGQLQRISSFRFGVEPHQQAELSIALEQFPEHLSRVGLASGPCDRLQEADSLLWPFGRHQAVETLRALEPENSVTDSHVELLKEESGGVRAICRDRSEITAELAVLSGGVELKSIFPSLAETLVPVSDIFSEIRWPARDAKKITASFRAANGHISGVLNTVAAERTLRVSGPRFLLPRAGIGVNLRELACKADMTRMGRLQQEQMTPLCSLISATTGASESELEQVLRDDPPGLEKRSWLTQDCLPCDELPLVGEWGCKGRVLGHTGWLSCNDTAAFASAHALTQLILTGKSENLHPRLSFRRLRWGA